MNAYVALHPYIYLDLRKLLHKLITRIRALILFL